MLDSRSGEGWGDQDGGDTVSAGESSRLGEQSTLCPCGLCPDAEFIVSRVEFELDVPEFLKPFYRVAREDVA